MSKLSDTVTALISTSPLHSHPSTEIIEETYAQLRKHFPDVLVLLLMDGVHPEEPHLTARYEAYKDAIKAKGWDNFTPVEFPNWQHQSGMLRQILKEEIVKTPLVYFSEHDMPLLDIPMEWESIVDTLLNDGIASIRFHLEDMLREGRLYYERFTSVHGVPLIKTGQHCSWPQIVRVDWLQKFIERMGDARTYYDDGMQDYFASDLCSYVNTVYFPPSKIARAYHTSGREIGLPKEVSSVMGRPYTELPICGRQYFGGINYRPFTERESWMQS